MIERRCESCGRLAINHINVRHPFVGIDVIRDDVPDGRYWLDCVIEQVECTVINGAIYMVRDTDQEIIRVGPVAEHGAESLSPRDAEPLGDD